MPFCHAEKIFSESGSFELEDAPIFLYHIAQLGKRIHHLKEDKPEIPFYQFYLSKVKLIPGSVPRTELPEPILSGTIVEHKSRPWREKFGDVALVQMATIHGFNAPLNFKDHEEDPRKQLSDLNGALLFLLGQPGTWNSIQLDQVFFYRDHQINYPATEHFYNDLLDVLANTDSLKELSIKPLPLSKHRTSLVRFLTHNATLESLHLETSEATRQDWLELSQILAVHPKLKTLNLGTSVLDAKAYSALAGVLDENYRVNITLIEPTAEDLLKAYEPLKQRLSKPGLERFKEDHLSQDKLLHVAVAALESLHELKSRSIDLAKEHVLLEKQLDFLLTNQGHRALTSYQKEDWVKGADVLPAIYQSHKEYLKNGSSLVQLHLDELVAEGSKTAGYVLLEKALETENPAALQTLLKARSNLFEFPSHDEEPFLVKVLQSKSALKKIVVEHIRRDQRLAELALECLAAYPDLSTLFGALKTHLDHYSSHLLKRDNPYTLLSIANEILGIWRRLVGLQNPADQRGKECAQIYLDLDKSLQIINNAPEEITYTALRTVQIMMQRIKENSMKALRGIRNKSYLHEKVVELATQFDKELEASKDHINNKKDEMIKEITENCERERTEAQKKQTQLEAENAEMKIKQAEMEAKQAEMEATLKSILRQMASNSARSSEEPPVSQNQERSGMSIGFFSRP